MNILSQNKREIINFNNITEIVLDETGIIITDDIYEDNGEVIGIYETEERAEQVLLDIFAKLTEGKEYYKMPKE